MKRTLPVLAGVTALLFTSIALAQGATAPAEDANALTKVTNLVFEILIVVLPVIAAWLAHRGIKVFEKKTGVDVPAAIESKIDEWVEQGIHLAAEKSRKKVKEKTAKLTGPEKLETAADFVWGMAQSQGWFEWTKEKIEDKVEALLGIHRANGGVPMLDSGDAGE